MNSNATMAQINYLKGLMRELGYDEEDLGIDIDSITKSEASRLIDGLKSELYG